MVRALFDTNVLIDFLNHYPQARDELARYDDKAISIVTWIEVMVGAGPALQAATRAFLANFTLIALDQAIADRAFELRRDHRIKLPDAVIWSSADVHSMLLVTRNEKDFPPDVPGIRVPYRL
jgi:predicted nucleic acid-binding protein